jgi:hypothetical protein
LSYPEGVKDKAEPAADDLAVAASAAAKFADADEGFDPLRAAWVRPWGSEPEATLRRAYAGAREIGSAAAIFAQAEKWLAANAAYDDPKHLPKLSKWLAELWQQPPPWEKPKKRSRLNGHGRRRQSGAADTGDRVMDYVMRRKAARKAREAQS